MNSCKSVVTYQELDSLYPTLKSSQEEISIINQIFDDMSLEEINNYKQMVLNISNLCDLGTTFLDILYAIFFVSAVNDDIDIINAYIETFKNDPRYEKTLSRDHVVIRRKANMYNLSKIVSNVRSYIDQPMHLLFQNKRINAIRKLDYIINNSKHPNMIIKASDVLLNHTKKEQNNNINLNINQTENTSVINVISDKLDLLAKKQLEIIESNQEIDIMDIINNKEKK